MSLTLPFLFFFIYNCASALTNGVPCINPCDVFPETLSIREGDIDDPPALSSTLWACPLQWLINHTENAGCTENTDVRKLMWLLTWAVSVYTVPWPLSPGLHLVQLALKCSDPWLSGAALCVIRASAVLVTDGGSCSLNQNPPHSAAPCLLGNRAGGVF